MEALYMIVPMVVFGLAGWFCVRFESHYAEKCESLHDQLKSAYKSEIDTICTYSKKLHDARIHRAYEQTFFAERLAVANERQRLLEKKVADLENELAAIRAEKQATYGLPDDLHGWCAKAAYMVLQSFPIGEDDRARLAATATIGALTSIRDASGVALARYLDSTKIDARLGYRMRDDETIESSDECILEADPNAPRDSDPDGSDILQ